MHPLIRMRFLPYGSQGLAVLAGEDLMTADVTQKNGVERYTYPR